MEPLEIAIQMESEGKEFYQTASEKSGTSLGKTLFSQLAIEEDYHAATARKIHDALKRGEDKPAVQLTFDQGRQLKSIFVQAKKEIEAGKHVAQTDTEAIETALSMEEKSRKYYEEQSSQATNDFEREFFRLLKAEERGHYLSLAEYREYLADPTGYFSRTEHISLDGG
jgi:rubrerythrin